jgi:hypothetical protein
MIPNYRMMIGLFYEYNNKYFGGSLPDPKLKIRHSYRILGYFSCSVNYDGTIFNECIELSDNYDYTEKQLRDILVHEMIHYYLAYFGIDVKCKHGNEFMKKASELNSMYGMNITPAINLSGYNIRKGKSKLMFALSTLF